MLHTLAVLANPVSTVDGTPGLHPNEVTASENNEGYPACIYPMPGRT